METQKKLRLLNEDLNRRLNIQTKELIENQARLRSLVLELNKVEHLEQQRIAAELHSNPAQLLAAARMAVDMALKKIKDRNALALLEKVKHRVSDAQTSVYELMQDLSVPGVLEHGDLLMAIRWVVQKMEKNGLFVEISCNREGLPIDRDWLLVLFQSVRELLQNINKYACASKAFVKIHHFEKHIDIEVLDNGQGFDVSARTRRSTEQQGGFGLLNIQERIRALGGDFQIESVLGEGTRAKLRIPVPSTKE